MTARDRIRAINEGRTPGPCTHGEVETNVSRGRLTCRKCRLSVSLSDARAIVAWERLSGPFLDLWADAQRLSDHLFELYDLHIDREFPWEADWKALRDALAAIEAAAKEVPE